MWRGEHFQAAERLCQSEGITPLGGLWLAGHGPVVVGVALILVSNTGEDGDSTGETRLWV